MNNKKLIINAAILGLVIGMGVKIFIQENQIDKLELKIEDNKTTIETISDERDEFKSELNTALGQIKLYELFNN